MNTRKKIQYSQISGRTVGPSLKKRRLTTTWRHTPLVTPARGITSRSTLKRWRAAERLARTSRWVWTRPVRRDQRTWREKLTVLVDREISTSDFRRVLSWAKIEKKFKEKFTKKKSEKDQEKNVYERNKKRSTNKTFYLKKEIFHCMKKRLNKIFHEISSKNTKNFLRKKSLNKSD